MDFFNASYFQLIKDNDKISIQKQEKTQNILFKVQEIMEKNDNKIINIYIELKNLAIICKLV